MLQYCFYIEFGKFGILIFDVVWWDYFDVFEQFCGFVVFVCFDDCGDYVGVVFQFVVCFVEYGVGFVYVGGCVQIDLQLFVFGGYMFNYLLVGCKDCVKIGEE